MTKKTEALTPEELAEIESVGGIQDTRDDSKYLPFIKINHSPVVNGKAVAAAAGTYRIERNKKALINAETLTGHILAVRYRFVMRGDKGKTLATTTFETSPAGEFIDTLGTVRCSKRYAPDGGELSSEDKAYNKTIDYECYLYMMVSGTGTDDEGNEVSIENELVQFTRSGARAIEANEFVNSLVADRQHQVYDWTVELVEPELDGKWYIPSLSKRKERTVTRTDLEGIRHIKGLIEDHNSWVLSQHEKESRNNNASSNNLEDDFAEEVVSS